MKKLIIFRHGDYELDANKQLTIKSAKEVYARAKLISDIMGKADLILTSPVLRAVQTADVIAKAMDIKQINEEPILAERYDANKELMKEAIINKALDLKSQILVIVTHYPNIKQIFNISLEPGMEIILEADEWKNIFNARPSTLLTKFSIKTPELIEQYFCPTSSERDLQELNEIDFLHGRL